MTLGALIVLAVLVVAGIYVPRSSWTHAKSPDANAPTQTPMADTATPSPAASSPAPSSPGTDMAPPAAAPIIAPADSSAGARSSTAPPAPPATPNASVDNANSMQPQAPPPMVKSGMAHHAKKLAAQNGMADDAASSQGGGETVGSPSADTSAELDELEKTVDQLSNRAAAVNSGLDRLQQQQAASGYGLRSDMVERQASLKSNLYKAEEALQHHDVARAKKYADLAEGDAGVLERFLGH